MDTSKKARGERLRAAEADFDRASALARSLGLELIGMNMRGHYHLRPLDQSWILNLWPATCKVYSLRKEPALEPEQPWTLAELVEYVAETWSGCYSFSDQVFHAHPKYAHLPLGSDDPNEIPWN